MIGDMPSVHIEVMAQARQQGAIRSVAGWQYPVALLAMAQWEAAEKERRLQYARRVIKAHGARFELRKVFRE